MVDDSKPWVELTDREIVELAVERGFLAEAGPADKIWHTVSKVRSKVFMAEVMNGANGRPWGQYRPFVAQPPLRMTVEMSDWAERVKR